MAHRSSSQQHYRDWDDWWANLVFFLLQQLLGVQVGSRLTLQSTVYRQTNTPSHVMTWHVSHLLYLLFVYTYLITALYECFTYLFTYRPKFMCLFDGLISSLSFGLTNVGENKHFILHIGLHLSRNSKTSGYSPINLTSSKRLNQCTLQRCSVATTSVKSVLIKFITKMEPKNHVNFH